MGNTESNEIQLFIGIILQLLSKREIKVKKSTIQSFFTFVQEHCPWFLQQGTVSLDIWEKVGKQLRAYCAHHSLEKIPTYTFPLWNMTRDALHPAQEFEKVPVKEESEVAKTPVKQKSESEKVPVINKSETEEVIPSYWQLNEWLAAMTANEHVKIRDEKKDQLSPQDEKDLEETAVRCHSDEDWSFLAKDAPKSLRKTSLIRPSAPRSLRETSPIRGSLRFSHQTVKGSPE